MSFDTNPQDGYERILCSHPESDSLFEVFSRAEFESLCQNYQVNDVTGVEFYENEFKKYKGGENG